MPSVASNAPDPTRALKGVARRGRGRRRRCGRLRAWPTNGTIGATEPPCFRCPGSRPRSTAPHRRCSPTSTTAPLVGADDVHAAVDLTLRAKPDLIVLGGDYVTFGDREFVEPVAELLAPLRAPHGVFAILGNHDDDRDMPAALAAAASRC